jgi:ABC-2 type transport system permease protein
VVLGQLGPLLRLPPWVMKLSPFTHVPRLPGGVFEVAPLLALQGVAALLAIAGLLGWQRRDVG